VAVEWNYERNKICGVIISPAAVARQGDGPNYDESFKEPLHAGTEFEVTERRSGWLHIVLSDSSKGWIEEKAAELL
jgi:hypothetical protein